MTLLALGVSLMAQSEETGEREIRQFVTGIARLGDSAKKRSVISRLEEKGQISLCWHMSLKDNLAVLRVRGGRSIR